MVSTGVSFRRPVLLRIGPRTYPHVRAIALALAVALTVVTLTAGSLMSVNPLGASSGVAVQITGTGFNTTASRNQVTFAPKAGGASQTATATSVATLDATKGIRRLNVVVPAGLSPGTASLRVTNSVSGETSDGLNIEILELTLPSVSSATRGTTGLQVVLQGSSNTQFGALKAGRVTFGAGVTVRSIKVETPQRAVATIDIASSAALGTRSVTVRPVNQYLLAKNAFTITAPQANRAPVAVANGPYAAIQGQSVAFTSTGSSDPDGDALQFTWDFGDGAKSSDANPQHVYTTAGPYTAMLTVSDGKGGSHSATAQVTIASPVTLQSLEITPPIITLRELTATLQTTVRGSFSDGSVRDLTRDPGTSYSIDNGAIASVSDVGLVSARASGAAIVTARNGALTASAEVRVVITEGTGFIRGEAFDDSRGVPLGEVSATLLSSAGAALTFPQTITADERGRFMLPAGAGVALIRIERNGFSAVDRHAMVTSNGVVTLLDARLTPLDGRVNLLQSVFGGESTSADGSAVLTVPSGSLEADAALRVTPISAQGLQGVLPIGWSPIAAVDLQPAGRRFTQPATIRLPHVDILAASATVALARYDDVQRRWLVQSPGQVSDDRRTLTASIDITGQFVFVIPDEAPFTPPSAVPGEPLMGGAAPVVADASIASGEVVPRSAPPGEGARAIGTLILTPPSPLPSGAVLRARVNEQFDLLDNSRVLPPQFVQDVVLYARPRLGASGTLAARVPITPSLPFSIQQLSLGTVRLDVTIAEPTGSNIIAGTAGGSVVDSANNVLDVPPGALLADIAVGLLPLDPGRLSVPIPDGFAVLGAVVIDLVGAAFSQPAHLSIPRPSGLDSAAQIAVAQVISDGSGGRRLKIVGLGQILASRVSVQTTLGALTFDGVRSGGEYVFLQSTNPLGFVSGVITSANAPQPLALVTADSAPFAALTNATGAFIVGGRVGTPTTVSAIAAGGATASGIASLAALNQVTTLNLAMATTAPAVVATSPLANATNVARDTSIVVDFSKPIDPATISGSTVVLRVGQSDVSAQLVLSASRRRLTITPVSPLTGLSVHTLTLTSQIRDTFGAALAPFTPLSFTTLDPSKATPLALGVIVAELPDEDGLSLITGAAGVAAPGSAVVATNLRTQESVTVLSLSDGSFLLRLNVVIGDEIALTLRDTTARETTITISQFSSANGTTSIGEAGGVINGAGSRIGRVLPRALSTAGVFRLTEGVASPSLQLPPSIVTLDRFALAIDGAAFRRLDSLTLTESQGRFSPATAFTAPLTSSAQLIVPADFLVSASLRFNATALDRDGARRSAGGTTVIVAGSPDATDDETGFGDQFPTVFLTAPKQATPTQVVEVSAVAPSARIDFELPTTATLPLGHTTLLTRVTEVDGVTKLAVVDRFNRLEVGGIARLHTTGRDLPGASRSGEYVVVRGPLAFVTGRVSGPEATVLADGSSLIFEADGANGAFAIPVPASAAFTLRFVDSATGTVLGQASGQAPDAGSTLDLGQPLAPTAGVLTVTAQPDAQSVVDIGTPIVFRFSASLDRTTVTPSAFVVTDATGARVFGRLALSDDSRTVTFVPLRRWQFGMRYRYGIATSVAAASGAQLTQTFAGEFTTFAPRALTSLPVGHANDVATSGAFGAVATDSGLAVVDLAAPAAAALRAQVPLAGGARGIDLLGDASFTDRTGQLRTGTFAAVAAGNATGAGRLEIFDITSSQVTAIGSSQLTTAPGQPAPAGVPDSAGTPNDVVLTPDKRALVSVQPVGLESVELRNSVPSDPSSPGRAIAARYPAANFESINASALVGDRVLTVGAAGLASLDAGTLQKRGVIATGGDAKGVAALAAFTLDADGDGVITPETETFDLAAVANGTDGTLQFFRVPPMGNPSLLSAIRFASSTLSVTLDAAERLAYVGLGSRGVAIVDLDAPPAIQPIDLNHDGLDDRILGVIDTPGSAGRIALALERGVGFVADGSAGLSVLQLLPARTRFLSVRRDPLSGQIGDEEPLGANVPVRSSDDAVRVVVNAVVPDQSPLSLTINEVPDEDGDRRLAFEDDTRTTLLVNGLNEIAIRIRRLGAPGGSHVDLVATTSAGAVVATTSFRVVHDVADTDPVQSLFVLPNAARFGPDDGALQLAVGGVSASGRIVNVTASNQTTYQSFNPNVVQVTADGLLLPQAGGLAEVLITNGAQRTTVPVRVLRGAVVQALEIPLPYMTFTGSGEQQQVKGRAELSDGTFTSLAAAGATFESSDTAVVVVNAAGVVTAIANGTAVVTVRLGSAVAHINTAVELRTAPVLNAIDLAPFTTAARTDTAQIEGRATVTGVGSLEGLEVQFAVAGATAVVKAKTDYEGVAIGLLRGLTSPGSVFVTATMINPANGTTLSDSALLSIERAGSDAEPNDSTATATPVSLGRTVGGSLGSGDVRDVYRTETRTAGALAISVEFPTGTNLTAVRIAVLDDAGVELARFTPTALVQRFTQNIQAGRGFISLETLGASVSYSASIRFEQGAMAIGTVTPLTGSPGTNVVIVGSGFSTDVEDMRVLFGGIPGRVVSSTPTRVEALVPANGKDGPITVIATARRAIGPQFIVGNSGPRAPITLRPSNPAMLRVDPMTGIPLDVTRLVVFVDPLATRAQVATLAQSLGGDIAGENVVLGSYVLEFANNRTIAALAALRRQLEASGLVRFVAFDTRSKLEAIRIDLRDAGRTFFDTTVPVGVAFARARVFEAIEAIRNTPPYDEVGATFQPVNIAVLDTGFDPFIDNDFITAEGRRIVRLFHRNAAGVFTESATWSDPDTQVSHGTAVTSIIAALNNGGSDALSGGYGGLFHPGEANFEVSVYGVYNAADGSISEPDAWNALAEIAERDIDVINMSFAAQWPEPSSSLNAIKAAYRDAFALLGGRSLVVVGAGNKSSDTGLSTPAVLASELPFVMAMGATAVANTDRTGEGADSPTHFTNFGDALTMAAPGEELFAAFQGTLPRGALGYFSGTSAAAPLVASIAAVLQAIRPPGAALAPDLVRTLLVDSGDQISPGPAWQRTQPIRRVNALNAVRLLLGGSAPQMIYVADVDANDNGRIVGIDIDPLTGKRPTPPNPDIVIPLTVTKATANGPVIMTARKPTTLLVAPTGDHLYVVADGGGQLGHGLVVVNTHSNRAVDFIPFSGSGFPITQTEPAIAVTNQKPAMVFSKDGRLLYVAVGRGLVIVNAVTGKVVKAARDLPGQYLARLASAPDLTTRLATLAGVVEQGVATSNGMRAGQFLSALAMSPDGRTLYAAVHTGGGGGQQPGGLLAINVDLYSDGEPETPGLQTELTNYLSLITTQPVAQVAAGGFLGGDEPQGIGVSRDGKAVYLANGGLNFFQAIPPAQLDFNKFDALILGPALTFVGAFGGVQGVASAISSFANVEAQVYNQLLTDITQQADTGVTFIGAPGVTAVFSTPSGGGGPPAPSWAFPSDVGFGWNPNPTNGGTVINQIRFKEVFAKRPFGFAMRPDGERALVPFFQTGNFGVLDLFWQIAFESPPASTPKPGIEQLPDDIFHGFVAATDALRLDTNLWPRRGAFTSGEGTKFVPSPDENFLYAWHAEYAQNGRWAAAVHVGVHAPGTVTAVVPQDQALAFRLGDELSREELGGLATVAPGATVTLERGGGGLTIIDDRALTAALDDNAGSATDPATTDNRTARPFFATLPACGVRVAHDDGSITTRCTHQSVTYRPVGGEARFVRPRGVTIQPFVTIDAPRTGDHVTRATSVQALWRDARIRTIAFELRDLSQWDLNGDPPPLASVAVSLSAEQIAKRTVAVRLGTIFGAVAPIQARRYRITVKAFVDTGQLSKTDVDITYDDLGEDGETDAASLTLTPFLIPVITVPMPNGQARQLTAKFEPANSNTEENVTADDDVTYLWLANLDQDPPLINSTSPTLNLAMSFAGDQVKAVAEQIINDIKAKLSANGVQVDFKLATITVTDQGALTVQEPGLNLVQAVYKRDGVFTFSNPILVLAGLKLSKIDLEPSSLLNTAAAVTGAETLVKKVGSALGRKVNTPLILTPSDPGGFSFLDNEGEIELADVEFKYLGQGTITLQQLMNALERVITRQMRKAIIKYARHPALLAFGLVAAPIAAKGLVALIHEGIADIGIQLVDLKSSDTAVATVVNEAGTAKGDVTAAGPGIAAVKGELNLEQFGLGKASDAVPVIVLPQLTKVQLDPINILLCKADSPEPGRKVRSLATAKFVPRITIDPQSLGISEDANDFLKLFLPQILPVGAPFDIPVRVGDFEVRFVGIVNVQDEKVVWDDAELVFTVPNVVGVRNEYNFFDIPNIARVADPRNPFSVRILHQGVVGKSRITNFVEVPILGSAQGLGSITVTELCSTPFVIKERTGDQAIVRPGDSLTYVVRVGNSRNTAIEDVRITDVATYMPADASEEPIELTQIVPIGRLEARSMIDVPITIQAFGTSGLIHNRATVEGFQPVRPCQLDSTCGVIDGGQIVIPPIVPPPCAQTPIPPECIVPPPPVVLVPAAVEDPIITEMVLDPKQDWNDSAGGGTPFDRVPGTGAIDAADIWVEISSGTTGTEDWVVELEDATGAKFAKELGRPTVTRQTRLLTGFGVGLSPIVKVRVIDNNLVVRQQLDIVAINAMLGPATNPDNESLTWSIFGSPTPILQQFKRRPATINQFEPF